MKIAERIIDKLIRQQGNIDELQFGFMPGCETTNLIFILRQLQVEYLATKKNLHFAFLDVGKAFDQVPRDILWWALRKPGVEG